MDHNPGLVVLFGSGERAPSAQRVYDYVMSTLTPPVRVSILETPAGFEPNSDYVAGQVADFVRQRLQNYHPEIQVLPARKKGTAESPDNPEVIAPMLESNVIFMGPGSPTYAVRQLRDSLAWHTLLARHHLGTAIVLASAATISIGCCALPVYEIYKVGEDLFWNDGLDFWKAYGLSLAFVSHWDNNEGGAKLDTSRCFMGKQRFSELLKVLPSDVVVVGIDEHTALIMDARRGECRVMGRGGITILRDGAEQRYGSDQAFSFKELGEYRVPDPGASIPGQVWADALAAVAQVVAAPEAPPEVMGLV